MARRIYGTRSFSDDAVCKATGSAWAHWNAVLDKWGVAEHGHTKTAAYLRTEHGLSPWWAQAVTARYEWDQGIKHETKTAN